MTETVVGILIFAGIVTIMLLRKDKFGSFKFGVGKDGVKAEVEAAKPQDAPAVQSRQVTTQNIHYGLDKEGIEKELKDRFEKQNQKLEDIKQLLDTGASADQKVLEEKSSLEQELAGVQAKLADTKKALEEREKVIAETEKALENEKLKGVIPEEKLAEAKQKLEESCSHNIWKRSKAGMSLGRRWLSDWQSWLRIASTIKPHKYIMIERSSLHQITVFI